MDEKQDIFLLLPPNPTSQAWHYAKFTLCVCLWPNVVAAKMWVMDEDRKGMAFFLIIFRCHASATPHTYLALPKSFGTQ
jgi:hypothetical protein